MASNDSQRDAANELLRRRAARSSLIDFTAWTYPKYQVDPAHRLIAKKLDAVVRGEVRRLMIFAPPQHGKLLEHDTPVPTPHGWRTHGSLLAGDLVFGRDGQPVRVIATSTEDEANREVEFTDGSVIRCHANHEWAVFDRAKSGYPERRLETDAMRDYGVWVGKRGRGGFGRFKVDASRSVRDIRKCEPKPGKCIQVEGGIYLVGRTFIPTHNSELVSVRFPAYWLARRPDDPIILASYAASLAESKSRQARQVVESAEYAALFPGIRTQRDLRAVDHWQLEGRRGGLLAAGVGGPITGHGAMCFPAGTVIETEEGRRAIEDVAESPYPPRVLSLNHATGQLEWRRVRASSVSYASEFVRFTTHQGRSLACTPGHRIFVDQSGYRQAANLRRGDRLKVASSQDVSGVREAETRPWAGLFRLLRRHAGCAVRGAVRLLPSDLQASAPSGRTITPTEGLSPDVSACSTDTVSLVECLCQERQPVYDLQVEGNSNYFANGVLVHNCGIIDDPVENWAAAQSEVVREKLWDWYRTTFRTRVWEAGSIILIMTRWHEDDLAGRLLGDQPGEWEILRLPAIAETQPERDQANALLGLPMAASDPLGREPGEPLCPTRFSLPALEQLRRDVGAMAWASQYQGVPRAPEGNRFKRCWFEIVKALDVDESRRAARVRYWDKAGTSGGGDFTVGVLLVRTSDGKFYVEDVVRGQWSAMERDRVILATAERDRARYHLPVYIWSEQEPGSGGKESAENFVRMLAGYPVRVEPVTGSKEVRAEPFAAQAEAGNVLLVQGAWNSVFLDELTTFPNGKHDDIVDATSGAFNKLAARATIEFPSIQATPNHPRTVEERAAGREPIWRRRGLFGGSSSGDYQHGDRRRAFRPGMFGEDG